MIKEILISYALMLPFFIFFEWLLYLFYKKNQVLYSKGFFIGIQLFFCLLMAIFTITGIPGIFDLGRDVPGKFEISWIPFQWGEGGWVSQVLNIVLFTPVGFLLPALWESYKKLRKTVLTGLFLSCLIEVSQLFNFRTTDVNDLLMNTLGTLVGYGIYMLFFSKLKFVQVKNRESENRILSNSGTVLISAAFFLYFLIGKMILSFFWGWYWLGEFTLLL